MPDTTDALVSTDWLLAHLSDPDIRVVDASWYLPMSGRDPRAEYAEARIPGAVFFDIDEICDLSSPYPHMLPPAEKFASRARRLGLGDGNHIVVYDGSGISSAARVWWMFRVFGHDEISVLDGGFPRWKGQGKPLSDLPEIGRERHFTARFNALMVRETGQVGAAAESGRTQIIDARSAGRFSGKDPEPREGLRGGHIPGSCNLPFTALFDEDRLFKRGDALRRAFLDAGVDLNRPIITTCGSGVTASVLALGLHLLGHRNVGLYDGSWSEWGSREDLPAETGPRPDR